MKGGNNGGIGVKLREERRLGDNEDSKIYWKKWYLVRENYGNWRDRDRGGTVTRVSTKIKAVLLSVIITFDKIDMVFSTMC